MKMPGAKKSIIVLVVVLAAALWSIQLYREDAAVSLIETMESRGSRVLGTRVDIADAYVDWDSGEVTLSDMVVANPGGFSNRNMINVDTVEARVDAAQRVVERVRFSGVHALIEFRGARSNFEAVGDRVARGAAASGDAAGSATDTEDSGQSDEPAEQDGDSDGGNASRDDWRVESVEIAGIQVEVAADWTSDTIEVDAGGLSIDALDAGADDLVRTVAARFLDRALISAAEQVDNERLRESLMDKAEELRAGLQRPAEDARQ